MYSKQQWLKVCFAHQTKRIANPPADIEQLRAVILTRFPVLDMLLQNKLRPMTFTLATKTECISTSHDLLRIRRDCDRKHKIVMLFVTVCDASNEPNVIAAPMPLMQHNFEMPILSMEDD